MTDWLDGDGYPTEAALQRIKDWPIKTRSDVHDLVGFVHGLWRYADAGYWVVSKVDGEPQVWSMSTAGWSGNESLVEALYDNTVFWSICFKSHRRGGHYQFQAIGVIFPDDMQYGVQSG